MSRVKAPTRPRHWRCSTTQFRLFLATCQEIGTLHQVLEESGLTPLKLHSEPAEGAVSVPIDLVIQQVVSLPERLGFDAAGSAAQAPG